jgi:predicted metal-dependent hydrolase
VQRLSLTEYQQKSAAVTAAAEKVYKAARTIQDAWRSYNNTRIYKRYRDLLAFRQV